MVHLEQGPSFKYFSSYFDFVFVPMDATGAVGLGHGIVNMCSSHHAESLLRRLQGFHNWACGSTDVLEIVWNEQEQGLNRLVERLRNSSVMHRMRWQ